MASVCSAQAPSLHDIPARPIGGLHLSFEATQQRYHGLQISSIIWQEAHHGFPAPAQPRMQTSQQHRTAEDVQAQHQPSMCIRTAHLVDASAHNRRLTPRKPVRSAKWASSAAARRTTAISGATRLSSKGSSSSLCSRYRSSCGIDARACHHTRSDGDTTVQDV